MELVDKQEETPMPKKTVIIGASPFGSLMRKYLEQDGKWQVVAYSVERQYIKSDEFDGLTLVPFEQLYETYRPEDCLLLNTLGYIQMNGVRKRLFETASMMGYRHLTYIHPTAVVNSPLGEGCIVLENASIGYRNNIGEGCLFWMNTVIAHDCSIGNFTYWGPGATTCGNVEVGQRCFIGAGAVLRNRIKIADECVIGAGCYINRSVDKPGSVYRAPYPELSKKSALETF